MDKRQHLVSVDHTKSEAVFELLDENGKTETVTVNDSDTQITQNT